MFTTGARVGEISSIKPTDINLANSQVKLFVKGSKERIICIHITPHMFRHSFATLLLEEDVDIKYIQKILGHSSITTQIYTLVSLSKQSQILKSNRPRNKIVI